MSACRRARVGMPLTPDNQHIDLIGITLDIIGPGGQNGPTNLLKSGQSVKPATRSLARISR